MKNFLKKIIISMKIKKKKARLEAIQRWWDAQPQNYKNATTRPGSLKWR